MRSGGRQCTKADLYEIAEALGITLERSERATTANLRATVIALAQLRMQELRKLRELAAAASGVDTAELARWGAARWGAK